MKKPTRSLFKRKPVAIPKDERFSVTSCQPVERSERLALPIVPIFLAGLFLGGAILLTLFIQFGAY